MPAGIGDVEILVRTHDLRHQRRVDRIFEGGKGREQAQVIIRIDICRRNCRTMRQTDGACAIGTRRDQTCDTDPVVFHPVDVGHLINSARRGCDFDARIEIEPVGPFRMVGIECRVEHADINICTAVIRPDPFNPFAAESKTLSKVVIMPLKGIKIVGWCKTCRHDLFPVLKRCRRDAHPPNSLFLCAIKARTWRSD